MGRFEHLGPLESARGARSWIALSVESRRRVVAAVVTHDRLLNLELARGVNHRHLAQVFDTATSVDPRVIPAGYEVPSGCGVAVAALISGRTLHQHLAQKPMLAATAVSWALRLAEAVTALHARGAWHGGISPFSVIVEPEESSTLPMLSQLVVPPVGPYCSPERLKGAGPGYSDDVWALFATLFTALTGKAPYTGSSRVELAEQMLAGKGQAAALLGVDGSLSEILARGLAANPAERVSELTELVKLLAAWERNPRALPAKRAGLPRPAPKASAGVRLPAGAEDEIILDPALLPEEEGSGKLAGKKEARRPPPPSATQVHGSPATPRTDDRVKAERPRTTSLGMPKAGVEPVREPRKAEPVRAERPRTTSLGMPKAESAKEPRKVEPSPPATQAQAPRAPSRTSLGLQKAEPRPARVEATPKQPAPTAVAPSATTPEPRRESAAESTNLVETARPPAQMPDRLPDTKRPPAPDPLEQTAAAARALPTPEAERQSPEPGGLPNRSTAAREPTGPSGGAWRLPPPDPELVSSADAQSLVALAREIPQTPALPSGTRVGAPSRRLSFNPFERKRRVWPLVACAAAVSAAGMYLAVGMQDAPPPAAVAVEGPSSAPLPAKKAAAPKADPAAARDACVRSHFEEGALKDAKDLGFVCEDGDFRETSRALFALASGVSGDPARSADQSPLGWYELPATAIIRKSCCASLPPVLPETDGWCEQLQTVIRRVAEDSAKAGDLAPAARSFDKAVGCLFVNKIHRPYLYGRQPTAKARANFEQFLSRAAISQARR